MRRRASLGLARRRPSMFRTENLALCSGRFRWKRPARSLRQFRHGAGMQTRRDPRRPGAESRRPRTEPGSARTIATCVDLDGDGRDELLFHDARPALRLPRRPHGTLVVADSRTHPRSFPGRARDDPRRWSSARRLASMARPGDRSWSIGAGPIVSGVRTTARACLAC